MTYMKPYTKWFKKMTPDILKANRHTIAIYKQFLELLGEQQLDKPMLQLYTDQLFKHLIDAYGNLTPLHDVETSQKFMSGCWNDIDNVMTVQFLNRDETDPFLVPMFTMKAVCVKAKTAPPVYRDMPHWNQLVRRYIAYMPPFK